MDRVSAKVREIGTVRRGQLIQRVLVDGWSPAEAAAAFRVEEGQVVRWLAAYRRHGMASLRREGARERALSHRIRRLGFAVAQFPLRLRLFLRRRGEPADVDPAPRRQRDDGGADRRR